MCLPLSGQFAIFKSKLKKLIERIGKGGGVILQDFGVDKVNPHSLANIYGLQ